MNPPPGQPPIDPRGTLRPPGPSPSYSPAPGSSGQQAYYAPRPGSMPPIGQPPAMIPPPYPQFPAYPPFPMPPRPGGSNRGLLFGLLALFMGFGLILALIIGLVLAVGRGPAPGESVQQIVSDGDREQTVAIIPVYGVLFDDVEQQLRQDLETAESDSDVRAIVIDVDSPGGTVTDSHQMYEALQQFRLNTGKPVIVHMDSVAASGGYFIACAADEIVAEESTITGSIGVLISYPQLSEFAEKTGIRYDTIVADGSPHKNSLDIWEKPTTEALADIQAILNQQHDLFRSIVTKGRSTQLEAAGTSVEEVANGKVWLGPEAKRLGLVDHIGFIDTAIARAASRAGLSNPRTVRYTREPTLAEALGLAQAGFTLSEAQLTLESLESPELKRAAGRLLHELSTPHSLYLYRGVQ